MRWLKRDMLNVGIAIGILLFLVLITWILIQIDRPQPGHATTGGTVQGTPTVNTTAVVQDQLKQQDDKLQRDNSFPWIILNAVGSSIGTILLAIAAFVSALIGFNQWRGNRQDEQKKREEEQDRWRKEREEERRKQDEGRFQVVVTGLGSKDIEAKVGAAILLRTFLHPGYEQFYTQTFDLAVAHLRLPHMNVNRAESHDSFSQALTVAFKESFPLAREELSREELSRNALFNPQSLDASLVWLDSAYLATSDLSDIWMPGAHLRGANLSEAHLSGADLRGADLSQANLSGADLSQADLSGADLRGADLTGVNLGETHSSRDQRTTLRRSLYSALSWADLKVVGRGVTRLNLYKTKMQGVRGLSREELVACEQQGAVIDDVPMPAESSPTQMSTLAQQKQSSHDTQAPSASPAQASTPTPDTGDRSAASSKPSDGAQAPLAPSVQGSIPTPDTGGSSATSSQTRGEA